LILASDFSSGQKALYPALQRQGGGLLMGETLPRGQALHAGLKHGGGVTMAVGELDCFSHGGEVTVAHVPTENPSL